MERINLYMFSTAYGEGNIWKGGSRKQKKHEHRHRYNPE